MLTTTTGRSFLASSLLLLATLTSASGVTGRVVGEPEGDTIKVLDARRGVKARLYGIDSSKKRLARRIAMIRCQVGAGAACVSRFWGKGDWPV